MGEFSPNYMFFIVTFVVSPILLLPNDKQNRLRNSDMWLYHNN